MIKHVVYFLISCLAMMLGACNSSTDSSTQNEGSSDTAGVSIDGGAKSLSCGTEQAMASFYEGNPQAYDEAQAAKVMSPAAAKAFQEHLKTSGKAISGNPSYVIPVVFHVYGTSFNGKSVTNAIIEDALYKTNEDFQGQAADWGQVISQFAGVKDTLSIEFRLATIDPNGNSTTGIVYHANQAGFGNGGGYDHLIQADAWDNYKYMNVYIQNDLYNDGGTTNSGVAWYPSTSMSNNNTARVVYNGAYLGTNTSENFRSVLTHEFGHWLNLIHTFEGGCSSANTNYCSSTGDEICDTPQVDNSGLQSYNCLGEMTNWQNFMHYADQYANFTQDQVARMINALHGSARNTLWAQSNLEATGTAGSGGGSSGGSSGSSSGGSSGGGALTNGQTASGLSASSGNDVNYYIDVPSGATDLVIQISGGSGDADLYTQHGSAPTDSSYACRPYVGGNNESCSESNPNAGRWHIRVKAYSSFSNVSLTASYSTGGSSSSGGGSSSGGSSSGGSSSGGSSSGGSSSGGGIADACSSQNAVDYVSLGNGSPECVSASSGGSLYFYFYNDGASSATLRTQHGSGDATLYYSSSTWPTTSSYSQVSSNSGNAETININSLPSGWNYIMISGSHSGVTVQMDSQ